MEAPSSERPSSRGAAVGLAAVLLLTGGLLAWLQGATPGLYGYDGYFHVRYAEILKTEGFSRSFPWWQETFLRDRWADKDFLYHLLLIPFTSGDLIAGGKAAAVFFGAVAVGIFYLTAWRLRIPAPSLVALGIVAASSAFLYRLGFTRPLVLATALAAAGTGAILLGNRRWAFALAAIYPHVHISFHLLPCVALLHDLLRDPDPATGRRSFRVSAWTWAGAAAGALLNPYLPNNLLLWWVQNIRVLGMAWGGPDDLRLGLEIQAGTSAQLLTAALGVFPVMGAALVALALARRRPSREAATLLIVSLGFFGLTMMSRRFLEFWTPFTFLFAGVVARDLGPDGRGFLEASAGAPRPPGRLRLGLGTAALAAIALALLAWNAARARESIEADGGPYYREASAWMRDHVPPGETIFHLDWDDFPQLFFFNPQLRYLVGLDPTFMHVTSPERWRLWSDVAHGEVDDLYTPIRETFNSRWIFGIPEADSLAKAALRDPRFRQRYHDSAASVFELLDGYRFVTGWRLTGWYPNGAKRLFDIPLGGEPAGTREPGEGERAGQEAPPAAIGRAAAGLDESFPGGFVDLQRGTGLPSMVDEACAVAEAGFSVAHAGESTIAITTDDEVRVYVDGRPIRAISPLKNPPPGQPGGPPIELDQLGAVHEGLREEPIRLSLGAGSHRVLVKACKVGSDFGFFLRVIEPK